LFDCIALGRRNPGETQAREKRANMLRERERNTHDKKMETPLDWAVKLRKNEADSRSSVVQALSEEGH
jgi:hypothetical protein